MNVGRREGKRVGVVMRGEGDSDEAVASRGSDGGEMCQGIGKGRKGCVERRVARLVGHVRSDM